MKKIISIFVIALTVTTVQAEIKPVSHGTYKTEHVGGQSDIYVKLNYATDGSYFGFVLKCANAYNDATFTLDLGSSPEEALRSVDALLDIMDNGSKGEIYSIDDQTTISKKGKNLIYIFRTGYADPGYLQRRHLENAKEFMLKRARD